MQADLDAKKKEERARAERAHKDKMMYALMRMESGNAQFLYEATFKAWTDDYIADKKSKAAKAEHDRMLNKALLQWAQGDAKMMQGTMLHLWMKVMEEKKQADLEAKKKEERARAQRAHNDKMMYALMRMESGNAQFLYEAAFKAWTDDYIEDKKRKAAKAEHDRMLNKVLLQWAQGDAKMMQGTMFHLWMKVLEERKQADLDAKKKEERARAQRAHNDKMMYALMRMESGNAQFLYEATFKAW